MGGRVRSEFMPCFVRRSTEATFSESQVWIQALTGTVSEIMSGGFAKRVTTIADQETEAAGKCAASGIKPPKPSWSLNDDRDSGSCIL